MPPQDDAPDTPSYRFVSPVNRKCRDLYEEVMEGDEKKKRKTNYTFKFSISSEAALETYLNEEEPEDRERDFDDRSGMRADGVGGAGGRVRCVHV